MRSYGFSQANEGADSVPEIDDRLSEHHSRRNRSEGGNTSVCRPAHHFLTRSAIIFSLCLLVLAMSVSDRPAMGQSYNSTDYVRTEFQRHLGREPSPNELSQWNWSLAKGLALAQLPTSLLASDEYYQRQGATMSGFVTSLYATSLQRRPAPAELSQWLTTAGQLGGDRAKVVQEFQKAAEREKSRPVVLPSPAPQPLEPLPPRNTGPTRGPGGISNPNRLPLDQPDSVGAQRRDQLISSSELLERALQTELGGTFQGRQATAMAANLVNASRSLVAAIDASPENYPRAHADVRTALTALESQLANLHFAAPESGNYLNRYSKIFDTLGYSVSKPIPLPTPPPRRRTGIDSQLYNDILREASALSGDTQKTLYSLRSITDRDAFHTELLRDAEYFYAQVDALYHSLRVGLDRSELQASFDQLRNLATRFSETLQRGDPRAVVTRAWVLIPEDMQRIGTLIHVPTGPAIRPDRAVLYSSPTFNHLPYQVQFSSTPVADRTFIREAITSTDEAMANTEAFVASLNYLLAYSPLVPSLQVQARALKSSLAAFREALVNGDSRRVLLEQLDTMQALLKSLDVLRTQMVRESRLRNAPDLTGISASIESLSRTIYNP